MSMARKAQNGCIVNPLHVKAVKCVVKKYDCHEILQDIMYYYFFHIFLVYNVIYLERWKYFDNQKG